MMWLLTFENRLKQNSSLALLMFQSPDLNTVFVVLLDRLNYTMYVESHALADWVDGSEAVKRCCKLNDAICKTTYADHQIIPSISRVSFLHKLAVVTSYIGTYTTNVIPTYLSIYLRVREEPRNPPSC